MNKIGINPSIVAHHEEEEEDDDGSDSKTIHAVVNALSEQAEHANTSMDSDGSRSVLTEIGRSLHILTASLPKPKFECDSASVVEHQPIIPWTPFHPLDSIQSQSAENLQTLQTSNIVDYTSEDTSAHWHSMTSPSPR